MSEWKQVLNAKARGRARGRPRDGRIASIELPIRVEMARKEFEAVLELSNFDRSIVKLTGRGEGY